MIDDKKVIEEILIVIENENLFDVDSIFAYYKGCGKTAFYAHKLNESNAIKDALQNNRTTTKQDLKRKWFESENPTVQIALFKLIATPEERKNLSQNYNDITTDGEPIKQVIQINGQDLSF